MYWADKGKIFKVLKNSLHVSLFLAPIIILMALFCNLNKLLVEFPRKIFPEKSKHRTLLSEKKHSLQFLMHHLLNII